MTGLAYFLQKQCVSERILLPGPRITKTRIGQKDNNLHEMIHGGKIKRDKKEKRG
jgi:hypothetical protein